MIFTTSCSCCGRAGPDPCAGCVDAMVVLAAHDLDDLDPLLGEVFDRCLALVDYDDTVAELVAGLKFRRVRSAVGWIAMAMADRLVAAGERLDVVTWVPASRKGRRRRGYDQGEVVARAIARRLGIDSCDLLARRDTHSQVGRARSGRLDGPNLIARSSRRSTSVAGAAVVVIDDVVTTGASLAAAGRALDDLEPARLVALALAHRRFVPGELRRPGPPPTGR